MSGSYLAELAPALLNGGVSAVVAAHGIVSDHRSDFSVRFFETLIKGGTLAEAVLDARCACFTNRAYDTDLSWAQYAAFGDSDYRLVVDDIGTTDLPLASASATNTPSLPASERDAVMILCTTSELQWARRLVPHVKTAVQPLGLDVRLEDDAAGLSSLPRLQQELKHEARAVIPLLSPAYLASPLWDQLEETLFEQLRIDSVQLLWTLVRECQWHSTPYMTYQSANITPFVGQTRAQTELLMRNVADVTARACQQNEQSQTVAKTQKSARGAARPRPPAFDYSLVLVSAPPSITFDDPPENHGPHVMTRGRHTLQFSGQFRIGEYLITNENFLLFIRAGGYSDDRYWSTGRPKGLFAQDIKTLGPSTWLSADSYPGNCDRHPVTGISFVEARAFVQWLQLERSDPDWTWCLPNEDMWELSARSPAGYLYPWGNDFFSDRCNSLESGLNATSDVHAYSNGRSAYNCADMAGNVWELVEPNHGSGGAFVLCGGSFKNDRYEVRSHLRLLNVHEAHRPLDFGFRCAQVSRHLTTQPPNNRESRESHKSRVHKKPVKKKSAKMK